MKQSEGPTYAHTLRNCFKEVFIRDTYLENQFMFS